MYCFESLHTNVFEELPRPADPCKDKCGWMLCLHCWGLVRLLHTNLVKSHSTQLILVSK